MLLGPLTQRVKNIHMIGIGGTGMSGIAEILLNLGFSVTGSDLRSTEVTDHLIFLGAKVSIGHSAENVENCDIVVYSSAVHSFPALRYSEVCRLQQKTAKATNRRTI